MTAVAEVHFPFDLSVFLKQLPETAGCYLMYDAQDQVIYVGKAKNLKRRVSQYFQRQSDHPKTRAMVAKVARVEVRLTRTEQEALLLEYQLIKQYDPRYNIIFRDDKSYPYLYVSTQHPFPGIYAYRSVRKPEKGRLFGPFPSAPAVYEALNSLQKLFPVRQCTDTFFRNRARPCLQYQINRCTAPCVGLISAQDYAQDVADTLAFLEGRSQEVIAHKTASMMAASEALNFEQAAKIRDQIAQLTLIQAPAFVPVLQDAEVEQQAEQAWRLHQLAREQGKRRLLQLQQTFMLPRIPSRIECFDISHLHGTDTVAGQVVFIDVLPEPKYYRRMNIDGITPGDDPAAMYQALSRRLLRAQKEGIYPDLLLIDGGITQLKQAERVLAEVAPDRAIMLLAIAKGEGRKAGLERYYLHSDADGISLAPDDPVALLLQQIRDEAHRFALKWQRKRRKQRQFG